MKKETSNEDRGRIIEAYQNRSDMKAARTLLGVKRTTALGIIKVYNEESRIGKLSRGRKLKKLSDEQRDTICSWVNDDCSQTLKALATRCAVELGVTVSFKTIDRCLQDFHYSLKRTHNLPERRNDPATIELRAIYASNFLELLSNVNEKQIIFIDEVGFSASMRARRGRSLEGTRAVHIVPGLRMKNHSCCCAMNKEGMIHHTVQVRAYNATSFVDYLNALFVCLADRHIENATLVMDNVPFHRSLVVRELATQAGHQVMFLSPYSPFLNPIENAFSKWKQHVRLARAQDQAALAVIIEEGFNTITPDDCAGFFRHMFRFIPRCINREPIIDE